MTRRDDPGVQGTDLCVKCGLCLPQCPTWRFSRQEADSPRGRIELIAALDAGKIPLAGSAKNHLDGCLLCRTCESVCPVEVPFGAIMDEARRRWPVSGPSWTLMFGLASARWGFRWLLWFLQRSRLMGVARTLAPARMRALLDMLPGVIVGRRKKGCADARVGLFPGCVSDAVDRQTSNDVMILLRRAGVAARWLPSGCCGALDRHQGRIRQAGAHVRRNLERTDPEHYDALLSMATGCGLELSEYPGHTDHSRAPLWADRHQDVLSYLHSLAPGAWKFRELEQTVLLHHPCSARDLPGHTEAASELLRRIPSLRVQECTRRSCCGAAGVAMLRNEPMARELGDSILQGLQESNARVLLTSNIGCALHLRKEAKRSGLAVEVLHPVSLLRRQLEDAHAPA